MQLRTTSKPRPNPDPDPAPEPDPLALAAAQLYARGFTHEQIRKRLGLPNQPAVSRLLKPCKGLYWDKRIVLLEQNVANLEQEVRDLADEILGSTRIDAGRLAASLGAPENKLLSVWVVPAGSCDKAASGHANNRIYFARAAAARVLQLMRKNQTWGVTWGAHLEMLSRYLPAPAGKKRLSELETRFVPLAGEAYGASPTALSSTSLAQRLSPNALSLAMIPAFIPSSLSKRDCLGVWRLIAASRAYLEIYGSARLPAEIADSIVQSSTPPAADSLHGILTSISRDNTPFGLGDEHLFSTAGHDAEQIKQLFIGDIGGVGLPSTRNASAQELQARWTGVTPDHLRACVDRATDRKSNATGVVVACTGRYREKTVVECIRAGMVSHLIIDTELAAVICRESGADPQNALAQWRLPDVA